MTPPTQNFQTLALELGGPLAHIRLSRPALLNRFDEPAHVEFVDALAAVARCPEARVLILSAQGRVFSAGGDFDEIIAAASSAALRARMSRLAKAVFHSMNDLQVPVIAAVQGVAAGMGATVAGLCDIVVASRNARFVDPHVAIGLVAGDGGIVAWADAIGVTRAKRYLLTGDPVMAEQAHAMGLVTDLVESPDAALPQAQQIGQRIAAHPRAGIEGTKRAFAQITRHSAQLVLDLGLAYEMDSMTRPEVAQAIARLR